LNISNDAWFGPTTGPRQHLNLASYRAIEEGLPMVRSTPTGISVLIDPLGRVVAGSLIDLNQRGFVDIAIPTRADKSIYSTYRMGPVALDVIFLLILAPFETLVLMIRKKPIRSLFRRGHD
jgi:apolipoprotein N-acyltransferase